MSGQYGSYATELWGSFRDMRIPRQLVHFTENAGAGEVTSFTYAWEGMMHYATSLEKNGKSIPCLLGNEYSMDDPEKCLRRCAFCIEEIEFGDPDKGAVDKNHDTTVRHSGYLFKKVKKYSVRCHANRNARKELKFRLDDRAMFNRDKKANMNIYPTSNGHVFMVKKPEPKQ